MHLHLTEVYVRAVVAPAMVRWSLLASTFAALMGAVLFNGVVIAELIGMSITEFVFPASAIMWFVAVFAQVLISIFELAWWRIPTKDWFIVSVGMLLYVVDILSNMIGADRLTATVLPALASHELSMMFIVFFAIIVSVVPEVVLHLLIDLDRLFLRR